MKDIFQFRSNDRLARSQNIYNLKVPAVNSTRFGTNSLSSLGPKIWNNLPSHLKSAESLEDFKTVIKKWNVPSVNIHINKNVRSRIIYFYSYVI